jgi:hypothetical protein
LQSVPHAAPTISRGKVCRRRRRSTIFPSADPNSTDIESVTAAGGCSLQRVTTAACVRKQI